MHPPAEVLLSPGGRGCVSQTQTATLLQTHLLFYQIQGDSRHQANALLHAKPVGRKERDVSKTTQPPCRDSEGRWGSVGRWGGPAGRVEGDSPHPGSSCMKEELSGLPHKGAGPGAQQRVFAGAESGLWRHEAGPRGG